MSSLCRQDLEDLAAKVVDAVFEVHRELGAGLLESAYEMAMSHELTLRGIRFERQKQLPVEYKGIKLECGFRADFLIEDEIILEFKSVDNLAAIHDAQILNYLRLTKKRLGFLINFNVALIKNGIKRKVFGLEESPFRSRDFSL